MRKAHRDRVRMLLTRHQVGRVRACLVPSRSCAQAYARHNGYYRLGRGEAGATLGCAPTRHGSYTLCGFWLYKR